MENCLNPWRYRERPSVGMRIEHQGAHHEEGCFGTVTRIEDRGGYWRAYLTDCHEYGKPGPDTFVNELAESWRPV